MIEFLAMQVRLGNITIEQVPERFRADVEDLLNANLEVSTTEN